MAYDLAGPLEMLRDLAILLLLLCVQIAPAQDAASALNEKVIAFVTANMKKRVGQGECWDLAAAALDHAGAEWDGRYGFGKVIDPATDPVHPGDIVRFERVRTKDTSGNVVREERMDEHTAIIYKVHAPGIWTLAHQNTDVTGRKVGTSRFLLDSVVKGKVTVFRPVH